MNLTIETNIDEIKKQFKELSDKNIDFAVLNTINTTTQLIKEEVAKELQSKVDRPTRYTLNSLAYKKANRQQQYSLFGFKEGNSKARSASKYLKNLIDGSSNRNLKAFEKAMGKNSRYYLVDENIKTNANGNISIATIRRIIQELSKENGKYFYLTRGKSKTNSKYTNKKRTDGFRGSGVYTKDSNGNLKAILIEITKATYDKKIRYNETITRAFNSNVLKQLSTNVDKELNKLLTKTTSS
jgi:hypothetical protein